MNAKLFHLAATVVALAAAPVVPAQPTPAQAGSEPIASATKFDGGEAINAVVQALNGDASLRNSKITVQQDGEVLLLTGAAQTKEQVMRATEVASASAGGAPVVNAIQPDHTTYEMPAYELRAG